MRVCVALLAWVLASSASAAALPEQLHACADRFDAAQRADAASTKKSSGEGGDRVAEGDVPLMNLARDCPEVLDALAAPHLVDLGLAERRMISLDWRALARALDRAEAAPPVVQADAAPARLEAILVDVAPAPLEGFEGRVLWRERLQAWALRQLRSLFGPDTRFGRWLRSLTEDDLRAFSDGMLAVVLVLFALLLAALGVVLYRFFAGRRGGGAQRHRVELPEGLAEVPLLPIERIRTLPPEQQPLALMRLVLARIDEDGLCSVRASMTNSEIASALGAASGLRIDWLSRLADRCLFGGHEAVAADLAPCWAEVEALGVQPS